MSRVEEATTVGVSPKFVAAIVSAVLTYVLGQLVLELPPIAVVAGQAVLVALAVYIAGPGRVSVAPRVAHVEPRDPGSTRG